MHYIQGGELNGRTVQRGKENTRYAEKRTYLDVNKL